MKKHLNFYYKNRSKNQDFAWFSHVNSYDFIIQPHLVKINRFVYLNQKSVNTFLIINNEILWQNHVIIWLFVYSYGIISYWVKETEIIKGKQNEIY